MEYKEYDPIEAQKKLQHNLRIAYMRGYQVGRRFEKRKTKKLLKKSKGI